MQPARIQRLLAYGSNEPLPVDGQGVCKIETNDRQTRFLLFFVVSFAEEPLLGISACQDLGLIKRVDSTEVSALPVCDGNAEQLSGVLEDPLAREYLELFQGLGHIRDHPYTTRVRDNVTPMTVTTACRVPFPLMEKVKTELQRMLSVESLRRSRSPQVGLVQWYRYQKRTELSGYA